jgi:2-oxoisovalerate dehydrogenase E2 component (dihydrolipoyl transacylase)
LRDAVCRPVSVLTLRHSSVEITSRYAGRVVETCYSVGEVARVGSPLCRIEVDDGEAGDAAPEPAAPEPAKPAAAAPEAAAPEPEAAPAAASAPEEPFARGKHASLATPAVRRITREEGIDIASVPGTGKDGRVTKEDVLGFVARRKEGGSSSGAPAPAPAAPQAGEQVVEMSSIRRAMFKGMTATWAVPHFGYSEEVDVTELDALRKSLAVATGSKLTLLPFLLKALSLVLPEHPLFRSTLDAASTPAKLRQRDSHDVSLALSSPFGLLTPSLPDLRTLSILEIAAHIASLQSKASAGPLSRADMGRPATLTLSNIGAVGGTAAAPLLPPTGQLAIGAVGRTKLLPRYDAAGNIVPRLLLPTSWSADHRVVEGAELARLVAQWKEMCEQPQSWLARLR